MWTKKSLKSFIREEDGRTIKKSLLVSSLGLVTGFALSSWVSADHWNVDTHNSASGTNLHSSTHSNHNNHSSY